MFVDDGARSSPCPLEGIGGKQHPHSHPQGSSSSSASAPVVSAVRDPPPLTCIGAPIFIGTSLTASADLFHLLRSVMVSTEEGDCGSLFLTTGLFPRALFARRRLSFSLRSESLPLCVLAESVEPVLSAPDTYGSVSGKTCVDGPGSHRMSLDSFVLDDEVICFDLRLNLHLRNAMRLCNQVTRFLSCSGNYPPLRSPSSVHNVHRRMSCSYISKARASSEVSCCGTANTK